MRLADLTDFPITQDHDAVGERQGFILIMGYIDRRRTELVMNAADFGPHLKPQLGIEIGKRLIHENHRRFDDDGAGNRHTLLLATGKLPGQLIFLALQPHQNQCGPRALSISLFARPRILRPKPTFCSTFICGNSA